jgi:hypothetical protein
MLEAVETILSRLEKMIHTGDEKGKIFTEYTQLLKIPAPTDKDKSRPVLAKYQPIHCPEHHGLFHPQEPWGILAPGT